MWFALLWAYTAETMNSDEYKTTIKAFILHSVWDFNDVKAIKWKPIFIIKPIDGTYLKKKEIIRS